MWGDGSLPISLVTVSNWLLHCINTFRIPTSHPMQTHTHTHSHTMLCTKWQICEGREKGKTKKPTESSNAILQCVTCAATEVVSFDSRFGLRCERIHCDTWSILVVAPSFPLAAKHSSAGDCGFALGLAVAAILAVVVFLARLGLGFVQPALVWLLEELFACTARWEHLELCFRTRHISSAFASFLHCPFYLSLLLHPFFYILFLSVNVLESVFMKCERGEGKKQCLNSCSASSWALLHQSIKQKKKLQ